jgi:3-phenylpropionate/trans-cinnamate dioxygenase ferredoxin reductase subunit
MTRFKYLIVGGGMTADSAAKGILSVDAGSEIGLITEEADPPYDRPPLSKGLWKGKPLGSIWRNTEARGVKVIRGRKAISLDPGKRRVVDDHGDTYGYDRLLLATGGSPKRHPSDGSIPIYYRTLDDYRRLRTLADANHRFVVAGGGFIGSEVAAALAMNGNSVVMAFPEPGLCGFMLPPELTGLLHQRFKEKGVRILHGQRIAAMAPAAMGVEVTLENGSTLAGDAVVAGLGIRPNTELAAQAGLSVDNGIVVDEYLRTRHADIFAAGDVASFPCPALTKRVRLEHEDNANAMGTLAGRNMAGPGEPYRYLPYFYSDLFDIGYEAIGETLSAHHMVIEWLEPHEKGAVFYLGDDRVRGVLLWNLFGKLDAARELMASPGPHRPDALKGWTREKLAEQAV